MIGSSAYVTVVARVDNALELVELVELVGHKMKRSHSHIGLEMLASMSSYTQWTMSFSLSPGTVSVSLSLIANSPSSGTTGILASPRSERNLANSSSACWCSAA